MKKLFLFSQNVKLSSFENLKPYWNKGDEIILFTTHHLFENEIEYLKSFFGDFEYICYSMFLNDFEQEEIDKAADNENVKDVFDYYNQVRLIKNQRIADIICEKYKDADKYILSNDLGIEESVWLKKGFKKISLEYYYDWPKTNGLKSCIKVCLKKIPFAVSLYRKLRGQNETPYGDDVYSTVWNEKKIIFIGRLQRVGYRIGLDLKKDETEKRNLDNHIYHKKDECQYITSIHERTKCNVPDSPDYDVRYIQDGYLPPNYSACDLKYIPKNVEYYSWDIMGSRHFQYHNIPVSIMPFRNKLYMPEPVFPKKVKTVLVATSGTGDWTAQKNRSDDDLMVMAFVEVARRLPDVQIIYRAHPTWIYPVHVGVNSINRVAEYFEWTKLPNIRLSVNIPNMKLLSFPRSSLEEDLKQADIVFGEHSVSMIDAAFKNIPFASVNLTTRRDLFCGLTELGFTSCKSADDIIKVINDISINGYQQKYLQAVKKYNEMTDRTE